MNAPDELPLVEQIKWLERDLETKERAYPTRIEMKRMTQKEADHNLAVVRGILATLRRAQAVPKEAVKQNGFADRNKVLEAVLNQVRQCAREHKDTCVHCFAVANLIEEIK